jgi:UDP-N-acetylmuramate: L-alanyl-gamma-D-glutamyl-meso-diaminopimelate ligase
MHARADNPEMLRAQELGLPLWSFPEFIYRNSTKKLRAAICGSHGKTTVTAMVMHALRHASLDFDYLVGAQLAGFDVMVRLSEAPIIVLEGDEYLSSPLDSRPKFAHYRPQVALISGIAWDHVNVFPTFEQYLDAFRLLIQGLGPDDHLVYNAEDPELTRLVQEGCRASLHPYRCPEFRVQNGQLVTQQPDRAQEHPITVIGRHNLLNAAGAARVAALLGVAEDQAWKALAGFPGAARRLELIARAKGRSVIRDFAHSPSKVQASTEAVAGQFGRPGFVACLELHTFSSLNPAFLPQYRGALDAAETAFVFFDPAAVAAKKLPPLSTEQVKAALQRPDLQVFNDMQALRQALLSALPDLHTLLLMSSGSFGGMALQELASFVTASSIPVRNHP